MNKGVEQFKVNRRDERIDSGVDPESVKDLRILDNNNENESQEKFK